MKKWTATIIAVAALVFTLASAAGAQTVLQIYAPVGGARLAEFEEAAIKTFKEKYPGVEIEVINSNSSSERLRVLLAAGTPPDIAVFPPAEFSGFALAGVLEPLNRYLESSTAIDPANIPEAVFTAYTHEGTLWGLAFDGFPFNQFVMYVNKDLFNQAGIVIPGIDYTDPHNSGWTHDELLSIAKKLTIDRNNDGSIDQWGYHQTGGVGPRLRVIWNFGGDLVQQDENGQWRSLLNSPQTIAALEFMQDLRHVHGVWAPLNQFPNGRLALADQPLAYGANNLANVPFDWTVIAHPRGEGGSWGLAQTNPMAIMADSKNKDLAWAFMEHWLSDEVQLKTSQGSFPPQTYNSARRLDWLFTDTPPYDKSAFVFLPPRAINLWAPNWSEIQSRFNQMTNQVVNGEVIPANAAQQLHEQVTALLQQAR